MTPEILDMTVKTACRSLLVAHFHHVPDRAMQLRTALTLAAGRLRGDIAKLKRQRKAEIVANSRRDDLALIDRALERTRQPVTPTRRGLAAPQGWAFVGPVGND